MPNTCLTTRYSLNLTMHIENPKIDQIKELCKQNKVKTLFAFGSVTRDDFTANSDIDLIVDFEEKDPFIYSDLYLNLKSKLEDLLKRQVDLLEDREDVAQESLFQTTVRKYQGSALWTLI